MTWPIELELPYPPTGNTYKTYRIVPKSRTRPAFVHWYLTDEAKNYKATVAWIAKRARVQLIPGPVEYEFDLYPELPLDFATRARKDPLWWDMSVRCMDLDNARKVLLDALTGIAWTDDKLVRKDPGEIMMPDGRARCAIRIKPYERAHPQLPLPEVSRRVVKPVHNLSEKPF